MKQINKLKKIPLNLTTAKNILCVKGFDSLREQIESEEKKLMQLVADAKTFFAACQKLDFVFSITYVRKAIKYNNMPQAHAKEHFHVPVMIFAYWDIENKRREIYDWETISEELNQRNASLDERLLHMRVFFSFKDFQYQARMIAENLKVLYKQNSELLDVLAHENMGLNRMPDFMLVSKSVK